MNTMLMAALAWHLVIVPTGQRTADNHELFKLFDVPKTFSSEANCRTDASANLQSYLTAHGLPVGATANFACTTN